MALAVAMVACQAATPKTGDTGATGDTGDTGPAGPPGTSDNASPMAVMPLSTLYVALGGSGMTPDKTAEAIDLSKHFKDDETPSLTYKVKSVVPKDVATVEIKDGKTVTVGKKAGTATVTIEVYDSVNDPIEGTFSVMVVASNVMPTVEALTIGADEDVHKLAAKIYVDRGASTVTVTSVIYDFGDTEGSAGDDLTFHPKVGNAGGDDDIVSVAVVKNSSKPDAWDVTLTPKKAGHQNVEVVVKDKFGSSADTIWKFAVLVNTKPSVKVPTPDRTVSDNSADETIEIAEYFTMEEKAPIQPIIETDTTDGTMGPATAHGALSATAHPDFIPDDTETASNLSDLEDSDADNAARALDVTCSYSTTPDQIVTGANAQAGSGSIDMTASPIALTIPDGKVAQYSLSIACRDGEHVAVSTSMITVLPE